MSSTSNSNIARAGSVSQERGARFAGQSTQAGSPRSGSFYTTRPHDERPQQAMTPPSNEHRTTSNLSPSATPLTFQGLAQHAQATAQLGSHSSSGYHDRVQAIHNTLHQLGLTLPSSAVAELARKFDGMTTVERFLAEEGSWVPPVDGDGRGHSTGTDGRPEDRRYR